jgi:hypothetical protein
MKVLFDHPTAGDDLLARGVEFCVSGKEFTASEKPSSQLVSTSHIAGDLIRHFFIGSCQTPQLLELSGNLYPPMI